MTRALTIFMLLASMAFGAGPLPFPTSPYIRPFLVVTNAAEARSYLGVSSGIAGLTTNIAVMRLPLQNTNTLSFSNGVLVAIYDGIPVLTYYLTDDAGDKITDDEGNSIIITE